MNLLFDLSAVQAADGITNHGGSEYAKAVFVKLLESDSLTVSVCYNQRLEMDSMIVGLIKKHDLKIAESEDINSLCLFIKENDIRVFYTALPRGEYEPLFSLQSESFKVILTIHGVRSLELPTDSFELYYSRTIKSKIKIIYKRLFYIQYRNKILDFYRRISIASKIITVSDHSEASLLKFLPELNPEKVSVCYSPLLNYSDSVKKDSISNYSLKPRKYFLVLSGSIWTKNSLRAIKAFDELLNSNKECRQIMMLITGLEKPFYKPKNADNFIYTGYLNREALEELYNNALALVYPTLNEGFGYPPLEAFKYGIPVLASGIGPIPEVCGNAAEYFNPLKIDEIKNILFKAIVNPDLFSEANRILRINRYNLIRSRQENDLNKLIFLLKNE